MTEWNDVPKELAAITLFVDDLEPTSRFYQEVFGLAMHWSDETPRFSSSATP